MKKIIVLISVTLSFMFAQQGIAQQFDYPAYPIMDLTFTKLEATLEIDEQSQIKGDVLYSVQFNVGVSDSIQVDAERMAVEDVIVNERTMDYEFREGKLTIFLDEEFERGDNTSIRIVYTTDPVFGVLQNYSGTTFSSQLPLSTSHWLPLPDHPGISFTTDISVIHPSSRKLVMTGRRVSNEVISVDQEKTRYVSQYPVPATALFFAIGAFQTDTREINNTRYHIHVEQPNDVELDRYSLMGLADETVQQMESSMGREYPMGDLHIVMMKDIVWENRTFGAGTVLADLSYSAEDQIKFGVAGQWAGGRLREMEWSEPEAIQLLMGFAASVLELESIDRNSMQEWDSHYMGISTDNIDRFRYTLETDQRLGRTLSESLSGIFEEAKFPLSWSDLSRIIYRTTGQPYFEKPRFTEPKTEEEQIYYYRVEIVHDEDENEVSIRFNATETAVDELVSVNVLEYTFNEVIERELTFTGANDEIVMSVPAGIENVVLEIEERDDIRLEVQKPFMLWVYQLRNGDTPDQRRKAARALREFSDNPDLQLALMDIIEMESDSGVYSEIVRTLSYVTDGASGTAQLFLDRTGSGKPKSVRIEAVRALGSYPGNDMVISRLQSLLRSAESANLREEAIHSLAAVTDFERFTTITESMIVQETVLDEVPLLLESLAAKGGEERSVQLAETFLSSEFPYHVRSRALTHILSLDQSQQGWERRIETLMTDRDPRVRYISVEGLQYLSSETREGIVTARLAEEFDERVHRAIVRVK